MFTRWCHLSLKHANRKILQGSARSAALQQHLRLFLPHFSYVSATSSLHLRYLAGGHFARRVVLPVQADSLTLLAKRPVCLLCHSSHSLVASAPAHVTSAAVECPSRESKELLELQSSTCSFTIAFFTRLAANNNNISTFPGLFATLSYPFTTDHHRS